MNILAMGADLGELYTALSDELQWVFIRWLELKKLYHGNPSRLELINRAAPFFFWMIQQVLWEDTLLAVARLAGPAKSSGKPQLAMRRLIPLIGEPGTAQKVAAHIANIDKQSDFAIKWRHRHIAHRELELALGKSPDPLPEALVEQVDEVLDTMAAALNAISDHFYNSMTSYRFAAVIHDADELVAVLEDGLRLEELRTKRLETGEYRPEEWGEN